MKQCPLATLIKKEDYISCVNKPPKTILVTGTSGFIAGNFVDAFGKQYPDTKIVGIDIVDKKRPLSKNMLFKKGDICDEPFLEKIFKVHRPEYVFHFAAVPRVSFSIMYPAETTRINLYGTILMLEKSRDYKAKRFIYSSSSSVYGGAKKLPTKEKENRPRPVSPYAFQKYASEELCKMFSKLYGLDTVNLRYFNVFGPGQRGDNPYSTVISAWLERLYFPKKHARPYLEGDGKQSRDFCFVDDVTQANIKAMESEEKINGESFNVAAGGRTSLIAVKKLIEKHSGRNLDIETRPPRIGDVRHTHADITKAKTWLGYRPETKLEEGLIKTIKWFESIS